MPPQLPIRSRQGDTSYLSSLRQVFSLSPPPSPHDTRARLLRSLLTRSIAVPLSRDGRITLPVRVRPAMIFLTFVCLILLGFLGLTPSPNGGLPIPDKALHLFSFFLSTILFYFIFSIPSSTLSHTPSLRRFPLYFTLFVSLGLGGVLSEFVQGALPYKIFDWGDIFANLLGGGLGLALAIWAEGEWRRRKEISRLYMSVRTEANGDFDEIGEMLSEGSDAEDDEERPTGRTAPGMARDLDLEDPWSASDPLRSRPEQSDYLSSPISSTRLGERAKQPEQHRVKGENLFSIDDEDDD